MRVSMSLLVYSPAPLLSRAGVRLVR